MVLELAVNAARNCIVMRNLKDFSGALEVGK